MTNMKDPDSPKIVDNNLIFFCPSCGCHRDIVVVGNATVATDMFIYKDGTVEYGKDEVSDFMGVYYKCGQCDYTLPVPWTYNHRDLITYLKDNQKG